MYAGLLAEKAKGGIKGMASAVCTALDTDSDGTIGAPELKAILQVRGGEEGLCLGRGAVVGEEIRGGGGSDWGVLMRSLRLGLLFYVCADCLLYCLGQQCSGHKRGPAPLHRANHPHSSPHGRTRRTPPWPAWRVCCPTARWSTTATSWARPSKRPAGAAISAAPSTARGEAQRVQ